MLLSAYGYHDIETVPQEKQHKTCRFCPKTQGNGEISLQLS